MQPSFPPLNASPAEAGGMSPSPGPPPAAGSGQAAPSGLSLDTTGTRLVFTIAGHLYACSTERIIKFLGRNELEVSAVSEEQFPWWAGVFVEQGRAVPLLTLRGLWGCKPLGKGPDASRQMVVLFESQGQLWGLLLDNCQGIHPVPTPSRNDLTLTDALTGKPGSAFKSVLSWKGQLLVTLDLEEVLTREVRQAIVSLMIVKYQPLISPAQKLGLRDLELRVSQSPSVEAYIDLADQYTLAGLPKEAGRLIRAAEQLENSFLARHTGETNTELFGRLKPGMLVEVVQALSRTSRSGELILETDTQTFHIYFKDGDIINTTSIHQPPGLPSFMAALQARQGTYRFAHRATAAVQQVFFKDTESLLLEAVHLLDEATPDTMSP